MEDTLTSSGVRQRLVAILAADVAGYSRLMTVDERGHGGRARRGAARLRPTSSPTAASSTRQATRCWQRSRRRPGRWRPRWRSRRRSRPPRLQCRKTAACAFASACTWRRDREGGRHDIRRRRQHRRALGRARRARRHYRLRGRAGRTTQSCGGHVRGSGRAAGEEHLAPGTSFPCPGAERCRFQAERHCRQARACASGQALDCGAAVCQHVRRPRAGVLRRRDGRRYHHRALPVQAALRDRAKFNLHAQRPRGGRAARCQGIGRALRPRGQCPQGGPPGGSPAS